MSRRIEGRVRRLGDHVNSDYIIASRRKRETLDESELKRYLLEGVDPAFAASVRPGDILVAGRNFGCGSAMEVAATVILAAGFTVVVAETFARAFYRNAVNNGLMPVAAPTAGSCGRRSNRARERCQTGHDSQRAHGRACERCCDPAGRDGGDSVGWRPRPVCSTARPIAGVTPGRRSSICARDEASPMMPEPRRTGMRSTKSVLFGLVFGLVLAGAGGMFSVQGAGTAESGSGRRGRSDDRRRCRRFACRRPTPRSWRSSAGSIWNGTRRLSRGSRSLVIDGRGPSAIGTPWIGSRLSSRATAARIPSASRIRTPRPRGTVALVETAAAAGRSRARVSRYEPDPAAARSSAIALPRACTPSARWRCRRARAVPDAANAGAGGAGAGAGAAQPPVARRCRADRSRSARRTAGRDRSTTSSRAECRAEHGRRTAGSVLHEDRHDPSERDVHRRRSHGRHRLGRGR